MSSTPSKYLEGCAPTDPGAPWGVFARAASHDGKVHVVPQSDRFTHELDYGCRCGATYQRVCQECDQLDEDEQQRCPVCGGEFIDCTPFESDIVVHRCVEPSTSPEAK